MTTHSSAVRSQLHADARYRAFRPHTYTCTVNETEGWIGRLINPASSRSGSGGSLLQTLLDRVGSEASVCRWPACFGGPGGGVLWLRCCLEPGLDLIYRDMCLGYSQSSLVGAKTATALLPAHLESRLSGSAECLVPSLHPSTHLSIHPSPSAASPPLLLPLTPSTHRHHPFVWLPG